MANSDPMTDSCHSELNYISLSDCTRVVAEHTPLHADKTSDEEEIDFPDFLRHEHGPIKILCQILTFFDRDTQIPSDIAKAFVQRCGQKWNRDFEESWNCVSRELLCWDKVVYHLLSTPTVMIQSDLKKDTCKRKALLFEAAQFLTCYTIDMLDRPGYMWEDVLPLIPHFLTLFQQLIQLGLHFRFIAQLILTSKYNRQYIAFPAIAKFLANDDSWQNNIGFPDSLETPESFHQFYKDFQKLVSSMIYTNEYTGISEWAIRQAVEGLGLEDSLQISRRACHVLLKACLDIDSLVDTVARIIQDETPRRMVYPDNDQCCQSRYHHIMGVLFERKNDIPRSMDHHNMAVQLSHGQSHREMYTVFYAERLLETSDHNDIDEAITMCEGIRRELLRPVRLQAHHTTFTVLDRELEYLRTLEECSVRERLEDVNAATTTLQRARENLSILYERNDISRDHLDEEPRTAYALLSYCCCILALGYSLRGRLIESLNQISEAGRHIQADRGRRGKKRLANIFYYLARILLQNLEGRDPEISETLRGYAANYLIRAKSLHHPEHYKQRIIDDMLVRAFDAHATFARPDRLQRTRLNWSLNINMLDQTIEEVKNLFAPPDYTKD